jgi:hypothetical protein
MRARSILAIAILAAGALAPVSADAAYRHRYRYHAAAHPPLIVPVEPRSFLDPGPVPPVGTYSRYVYISQYPYYQPYVYTNHYGEPPLPGFGDFDRGRPLIEGIDFGPLSGSR